MTTLRLAPQARGWTVAAPALLSLAALLLFTLALARTSLWDVDEALYATVAREIVQRGDPITLHFNGQPWFDKPPLYMWLVAATGAVFGFSEAVVRAWVALFGAAGVLVTCLLGRRLAGGPVGLLAGMILMTTLEYFILARLAVLDVPLTFFMLLVLYLVVAAEGAPGAAERRRAYRWAFVWAGLGTLVKGPVALLLPALVVAAWWALRGEWRRWRDLPADGVGLYVLTGLTWYLLEAAIHGAPFVRAIVGFQWFQRFFSVVHLQSGPWYYYAPVVALGALPWTAFLPGAIAASVRRVRRDPLDLLLLLWIGVIVLFYSLAATKLANYVLPIYPAAALLIARVWTAALWEQEPRAATVLRWSLLGLLATVAVLALAGVLWPTNSPVRSLAWPLLRPLLPVPLAGGIAVLALLARRADRVALIAVAATTAVTYGLVAAAAAPRAEELRPVKPLATALHGRLRPGDRIIAVGEAARPSLVFYADADRIEVVNAAQAGPALCRGAGGFLVAGRGEYETSLRPQLAGMATVVLARGDLVVLRKDRPIPCAPR